MEQFEQYKKEEMRKLRLVSVYGVFLHTLALLGVGSAGRSGGCLRPMSRTAGLGRSAETGRRLRLCAVR